MRSLGSFRLDLNAGELRSGSTAVLLQEQPFQVLRILLLNRTSYREARCHYDVIMYSEVTKNFYA
jgi:hypothetical protein